MAVYKSTRCYPFLNNVDIRVTQTYGVEERPVQYLKCKVDTSNKQITGYKIRILDEANNQVFPLDGENLISPITELQKGNMLDVYESNGVNSGLNGTYLYIPFFQNRNKKKLESFNALYYGADFNVEHIILDDGLYSLFKPTGSVTGANNITQWEVDSERLLYTIKYRWPSATDRMKNNIQLDGESLLEGQKVLVAASVDNYVRRGIYTVVKVPVVIDGQSIFQTELEFFDYTVNSVLVTHGETFHNTVWSIDSYYSTYYNKFYKNSWSGVSTISKEVPNISLSNSLYKWEITLYQGDGVEVGSSDCKFMDYSDIKNQDYDITVTSGTILGSTNSRIQIASGVPFGSVAPILPGLKQGTLVLQGKYMALGSGSGSSILSTNRVSVKNYDSSYGHVYTMEGDLDASNISSYTKAQFFKYSNNPDKILENEGKVAYGCGYNIGFVYYNSDGTQINNLDAFSAVSVNNRRYGVNKSDLPSALSTGLKEGDEVLFTGQNYSTSFQNGVYRVYNPGNNSLPTTVLWLKRASSYDSWSDFLGKIIYCGNLFATQSQGVAQSINLESLAGSGGYVLWDPDQPGAEQTVGGGPLYFSNERPILLFEQRFNDTFTYDLKTTAYISDGTEVSLYSQIDGIPVQEGFTVVCRKGDGIDVMTAQVIGGVLKFRSSTVTSIAVPSDSDLYYIRQGQTYGKKMYKYTSILPDWSLYTATVLHNTIHYTFITPFLNIEKSMCLKFAQNKTVTLRSDSVTTNWLKIQGIDNTVYCILHRDLAQPLTSGFSTEDNTPYKYEIRSYFKASDANPFYISELPYLILYKNNQEFSTLNNIGVYQEYWTTVERQILKQFNVTSDNDETQAYLFQRYTIGTSILDRAVKFSAKYVQFDGVSWESYRWALFDANGILLQDSGVRYDKSISAVFYGLSNSDYHNINYYVVLKVEDEQKNQLIYLIKIEVRCGMVSGLTSHFTAEPDCDHHAVRLSYVPFETDSFENKATIYRREYEVYEHPGPKLYGTVTKVDDEYIFVDESTHERVTTFSPNIIYVDRESNFYYGRSELYDKLEMIDAAHIYTGEWSLVVLKTNLRTLYDYNIVSGKRYQYLLYPNDTMSFDINEDIYYANSDEQIFANSDESHVVWVENATYPNQGKTEIGGSTYSARTGAPVGVQWDEWSICELIPDTNIEDTPSAKKAYKVNTDQIWLFKYSLETGNQTQNISRKEIQTLGTYTKMGFGNSNYASGEVTALLGSEIVLGTDVKYIERLKKSRLENLSTNEKIKMLETWREFVYSKNPKLLKDIKGQSWIVQIASSSNTPKNFYTNQPDTISFQWKQVDDVKNTIIYSDAGQIQAETQAYGKTPWGPLFQLGTSSSLQFYVAWVDWDGRLVRGDTYYYNATPVPPTMDTPRPSTAQYSYTFKGWAPNLSLVTENKTYVAQYNSIVNTYTITWSWQDASGTTHSLPETYPYGAFPRYKGPIPTKGEYTFIGWSPDITKVTQNTTYTAVFEDPVVTVKAQFGTWWGVDYDYNGSEWVLTNDPYPVTDEENPVYFVGRAAYGTPIDYNEDAYESHPGVSITYTSIKEGYEGEECRTLFYFVPNESDNDYIYDGGHIYRAHYVGEDGCLDPQQIFGYASREGVHRVTVKLVANTIAPEDIAIPTHVSSDAGYWIDTTTGNTITEVNALNGDSVIYYRLTDIYYGVVITHNFYDVAPEDPAEVSGTHLAWVNDGDGYIFNGMYLLHDTSEETELIAGSNNGDILGQVSAVDDNDVIYAYVTEK